MSSYHSDNCLEIITLGKFQVKLAGQVLLHDGTRSHRAWELFKYIISNRHKGIIPELALEELWPDQDYLDPRGAVRALVFRLRKYLNPDSYESRNYIISSQGVYRWNEEVNYWLDVDEFEKVIEQAAVLKKLYPQQAEYLLLQAVKLYQGEFLQENYYSQWTIPLRNYYHSLYLQAVSDIIEILNARNDNSRVISICERALLTHPYEELLHMHYMKTLIKEGRIQQAQNHYANTNRKFYQDLGIEMSPEFKKTVQKDGLRKKFSMNLNDIHQTLNEKSQTEGAFICNKDVFKKIYKLEQSRGERSGTSVFLAVISVEFSDKNEEPQLLKSSMREMEIFLINNLRKGDVIACWNSNQYILMLPGLTYEESQKIMERLKDRFNSARNDLTVIMEIQPVAASELYP